MLNITFESGYCIKEGEEYELLNLKIDDVSYAGSMRINESTDLGKAVLKYLKDNPEITRNFPIKRDPTAEEIAQQKQAKILEVKAKIIAFFDEVVKSRGYVDSLDCLSFLHSTNEASKIEATNFNQWRDNCLAIFKAQSNKYLSGSITLDQFTEDNLLGSFAPLYWDAAQKEEAEKLVKEQQRNTNPLDGLTLGDCKTAKYLELRELFDKYTAFSCRELFFTSTVRTLSFNGDFKARAILSSFYADLVNDNDEIELRLHDNTFTNVTKAELAVIIKELDTNMRNIIKQKWQYEKDINSCTTKEETQLLQFEFQMTFF